MTHSLSQRNFVSPLPAAAPTAIAPRAEIIRREDVLEQQRALLATYSAQQAQLLHDVQQDVRGGGYVSSGELARERRATSAMYLALYGLCAGGAMGGLTLLGMAAIGMPATIAIASWLAGTALATIAMAWRRHGQELEHSPEGIARHLLDWHGEIAMLEAETRRDLLQREHDLALLDRQQAAQAAAAQRQLAIDLAAAQTAARRPHPVQMSAVQEPQQPPPPVQTSVALEPPHAARTPIAAEKERKGREAAIRQWHDDKQEMGLIEFDQTQHTVDTVALRAAPPTTSGEHAGGHAALMTWAATLHDGGLTTDGIVLGRVPWSARSPWPAADKEHAARVCTRSRPVLFEQVAGGRWRVRQQVAGNSAQLLALLAQRGG